MAKKAMDIGARFDKHPNIAKHLGIYSGTQAKNVLNTEKSEYLNLLHKPNVKETVNKIDKHHLYLKSLNKMIKDVKPNQVYTTQMLHGDAPLQALNKGSIKHFISQGQDPKKDYKQLFGDVINRNKNRHQVALAINHLGHKMSKKLDQNWDGIEAYDMLPTGPDVQKTARIYDNGHMNNERLSSRLSKIGNDILNQGRRVGDDPFDPEAHKLVHLSKIVKDPKQLKTYMNRFNKQHKHNKTISAGSKAKRYNMNVADEDIWNGKQIHSYALKKRNTYGNKLNEVGQQITDMGYNDTENPDYDPITDDPTIRKAYKPLIDREQKYDALTNHYNFASRNVKAYRSAVMDGSLGQYIKQHPKASDQQLFNASKEINDKKTRAFNNYFSKHPKMIDKVGIVPGNIANRYKQKQVSKYIQAHKADFTKQAKQNKASHHYYKGTSFESVARIYRRKHQFLSGIPSTSNTAYSVKDVKQGHIKLLMPNEIKKAVKNRAPQDTKLQKIVGNSQELPIPKGKIWGADKIRQYTNFQLDKLARNPKPNPKAGGWYELNQMSREMSDTELRAYKSSVKDGSLAKAIPVETKKLSKVYTMDHDTPEFRGKLYERLFFHSRKHQLTLQNKPKMIKGIKAGLNKAMRHAPTTGINKSASSQLKRGFKPAHKTSLKRTFSHKVDKSRALAKKRNRGIHR